MPPETQFNWGLGWTISVPAVTLKPQSRQMQNVSRGPVLFISVLNLEVQCNFKLSESVKSTFTVTTRYENVMSMIIPEYPGH